MEAELIRNSTNLLPKIKPGLKTLKTIRSSFSNAIRRTPIRESKLQDIKLRIKIIKSSKWKSPGQKVFNHWTIKYFFIILIIWSLLADELKLLLTDKDSDTYFSISIIILQILFTIESVLYCIFFDEYFFGFYFWIDIISIITMLIDIHWFYNMLILKFSQNDTSTLNQVDPKICTMMRIVGFIRSVRISKFYNYSGNADFRTNKNSLDNSTTNESYSERLKIAKTFTDYTMRKVILLIIAMIIGIIILDTNFYYNSITSFEYGLKNFNNYNSVNDPGLIVAFQAYNLTHQNIISPILYLSVISITWGDLNMTSSLRIEEKIQISEICSNLLDSSQTNNSSNLYSDSQCFAIFDNRITSQLTALLNIIKIILIILFFLIASHCFNSQTESMVVKPLISMIKNIKKYSKNPVKAKNEEILESCSNTKTVVKKKARRCCADEEETDVNKKVETIILEKTIGKIGSLLALGYGVTGSNLIERNMSQNKGVLNPLAPGVRIIGVFCLCKLMFPIEIVHIFGENCAILINEIYKIIGNIIIEDGEGVYMCKNTGDGLLLIWKIEEKYMLQNQEGEIIIKNCPEVNDVIDRSVISIIQILIKLKKSLKLSKLQDNIESSGSDYSIIDNISFTCNLGWAIEGATGSNFKIDISYFSPMLTLTKELENLNKYYQRNLILFSDVSDCMTKDAKDCFRNIDSLKFKSENFSRSKKNINVYLKIVEIVTIDLDLFELSIEKEKRIKKRNSEARNTSMRKSSLYFSVQSHLESSIKNWEDFAANDKDFLQIRERYSADFIDVYNQAFDDYIKGNWDLAKKLFEKSNYILDDIEYLTEVIMNYMLKFDFVAPDNWEGSRPVESLF